MDSQQKQNNNVQKDLGEIKQTLQHKIDMAYVKSSGSISKDKASCKICKFLVRQQILECQKCKSYGCAVCVQSKLNENLIQKTNKCPFDNDCTQSEEYKKVNNTQLDSLLSSIKITCPGTSLKGQEKCTEVESLSYANCESHFAKCLFILRPCKICGMEIPKKFMPQHLSNECQQTLVSCDDCKQKILRKEFENHQSICPAKIQVVCKGCRKSFPKTDIEKHEKNCEEISTVCQNCQLPIAKKDEEAHTPSTCFLLKNFQLFKQDILQQVSKQLQNKDSQSQKNNSTTSGRVPIVKQQAIQQNQDQSHNQLDEASKEDLKSILNEVEKTSHSQQGICIQMQSLREEILTEIKKMNSFHSRQIDSIKQQQQNDQELFRKNFEVEMHFLRDEMSQIHNQINTKTKTNQSTLINQDHNQNYFHQQSNFQKQPTINLNDSQTFLYNDYGSVYQSTKNLSGNTPKSSRYHTSYLNPFVVKNYHPSQTSYNNQSAFQDNPLSQSHRYPHKENLLQNRRGSKTYSQSMKKNEQEQQSNSPEQNQKLNTLRGYSQNNRDNKEEGYRLMTKPEKKIQIQDQNENLPSINLSQRTPTQQKRKTSFSKIQLANISMDSKAFEELQVDIYKDILFIVHNLI
ncbi:hypothetical protein ABPG73_021339 [Tetrahymena malaccensis]